MRVYLAAFLLPVSSPLIRAGAVAVEDDRIVAVGPRDEVLGSIDDDAEVRDLGHAVIIPGLVNAHCHVELSWMADDPPPGGDYMTWLRGLLERRDREDASKAIEAATRAVEFMARRGTVALGDVANGTWVGPILARSSLQGVVFHEIYGPRPEDAERLIDEAASRLDSLATSFSDVGVVDRWNVALTPHAPHTTSEPLLRALAGRSAATGDPLSIHVSESKCEMELLKDGTGPFPELWRERGQWDDDWSAPGLTPVDHLDRLGVLAPQTLAVHCVHLEQRDHAKLQTRGARVVTCPRSNRNLGVGTAPVPRLLGAGVPVALGTDSLASVPDLDMFREMAALRQEHPGLAPAAVLRLATLNGAAALGLSDRLGSIERGKLAGLVVVPLASTDEDPLAALCSEPADVYTLETAPSETAG